MDIVLVLLEMLFFVPVFLRLAARRTVPAGTSVGIVGEIAAGARRPAMVLHGVGLLLLWTGLALAVVEGRVPRSLTFRSMVGAALLLCASLLMAWSIVGLRSWRLLPTVDAEHELCTTGPYGLVRHPMYLAIDLLAVGSAVWVPTPLVLIGAVALAIGGDLRARIEERALLEAFGERYRNYLRRVRRTVPGIY